MKDSDFDKLTDSVRQAGYMKRIADLEQQLAEVVALHAKVSSQNIELTGKMEQLFASVNRDLHNFPAIFLDWFDDKGRSK